MIIYIVSVSVPDFLKKSEEQKARYLELQNTRSTEKESRTIVLIQLLFNHALFNDLWNREGEHARIGNWLNKFSMSL